MKNTTKWYVIPSDVHFEEFPQTVRFDNVQDIDEKRVCGYSRLHRRLIFMEKQYVFESEELAMSFWNSVKKKLV